MYGPDVAVLKGKTTQSTAAPRVPTFEAVLIPTTSPSGDALYGFLFRTGTGFRTVRQVPDRSKAVILQATRHVVNLYNSRGFNVCDIHADNEFECIREDVRPVEVNAVTMDSHVGEVERSVRTIKERLRTCVHGLPFERLPKLMIRHMVIEAVRCLNQFPWKHGISDDMSPAALVTGHPPPDFQKMRLEFGTYVQVFEDNDPTNSTRTRSMGAIALGPTGNAQGDYNFMSLATGAKISRHQWTAFLPMTDTAIARVHALGIQDEQPLLQERGLVVEWRPDQPIDESEYDRDYALPRREPADAFAPGDFDPVDPNEAADLLADAAAHDLFIEPENDPVVFAQGGDEDVNPAQHPENLWLFDNPQPAIVAPQDDDNDVEHDDDVAYHDNDAHDADAVHEADALDDDEADAHEDDTTDEGVYEDEALIEGAANGGAHEIDATNEGAHRDEDDEAGNDTTNKGAHGDDDNEAGNEAANAGNDARPYNL
ncbi:Reverse transcriptase (RNA-dependent DNA polymerase) [Fragilaria crotonensis]|nr:Reverse transcriptase (RNA-dependent DNA polymerase) [Fragilaria crotonensis]